jgi:hypothetical protein
MATAFFPETSAFTYEKTLCRNAEHIIFSFMCGIVFIISDGRKSGYNVMSVARGAPLKSVMSSPLTGAHFSSDLVLFSKRKLPSK